MGYKATYILCLMWGITTSHLSKAPAARRALWRYWVFDLLKKCVYCVWVKPAKVCC